MRRVTVSLVALVTISLKAGGLEGAFLKAKISGELRGGAVQLEDDLGHKNSTLAVGGNLGIKTAPISGVSMGATFYTTNPLFGKNQEGMFLSSKNSGYSIVAEAYIQVDLGKTTIKAGRQLIDTPYIGIDDIGMVPDTYEGYTLINQDISNTTIVLVWLDKWAGFDAPTRDRFTNMQNSSNAVLAGGVIYEGSRDTTLQAWHYKLENVDFIYFEAGYETEQFNIAGQYTNQDNSNSAFGLLAGVNIGNLALNTAYNRVDGEVSNGFGGGPFFTSSKEHTIAKTKEQEALLLGAEYIYNRFTIGFNHTNFDKGENESDYRLSYAFNDRMSFDLIYSDMYNDGKMTKVFAKYSF